MSRVTPAADTNQPTNEVDGGSELGEWVLEGSKVRSGLSASKVTFQLSLSHHSLFTTAPTDQTRPSYIHMYICSTYVELRQADGLRPVPKVIFNQRTNNSYVLPIYNAIMWGTKIRFRKKE